MEIAAKNDPDHEKCSKRNPSDMTRDYIYHKMELPNPRICPGWDQEIWEDICDDKLKTLI